MELEARQEELRAKLENAYAAAAPTEAEELNREYLKVRTSIDDAYAEWEELAARIGA